MIDLNDPEDPGIPDRIVIGPKINEGGTVAMGCAYTDTDWWPITINTDAEWDWKTIMRNNKNPDRDNPITINLTGDDDHDWVRDAIQYVRVAKQVDNIVSTSRVTRKEAWAAVLRDGHLADPADAATHINQVTDLTVDADDIEQLTNTANGKLTRDTWTGSDDIRSTVGVDPAEMR